MVVQKVVAEVDAALRSALTELDHDAGASPVLRAVVEEFARKLAKNRSPIEAGGAGAREAVVELEQAGDSARWAAEADAGAAAATRQAIVDAHDWICTYKATGELLRP